MKKEAPMLNCTHLFNAFIGYHIIDGVKWRFIRCKDCSTVAREIE